MKGKAPRILSGQVWKFKDNVDTDQIIPARYLNSSDPAELAAHVMEDADPDFVKKYAKGDIIVAGENFGCGSSREHAPIAIKAAGIQAVIAKSFARIFYRNAINIGLPILEVKDKKAIDEIHEGDEVEIDLGKGTIKDLTRNKEHHSHPFPEFMQNIMNAGGLMEHIKNRLKST